MRDKREVLQTLLDTSKLATDLFDLVEVDNLVIDQQLVMRVSNLSNRLAVLKETFIFDYAMSGRAAKDMLAGVQAELRDDHHDR